MAPDLVGLLRALPAGKTVWVEVRGRSMWPLLWPGDQLKVQRCGPSDFARGDVAVMARDNLLVSHFVIALAPFTTASIIGTVDDALEPLGRAIAVRRKGRELPLWRPASRLFQRTWSLAARSPLQLAWQASVSALTSPATAALRTTMFGRPTVHAIEQTDLHDVAIALSRWSSFGAGELEQLVREGRGVIARGPSRQICGVAFSREHVYLARRWHGLGLEAEMLAQLER